MDGTILCQGTFVANSTGLANPNPGVGSVGTAVAAVVQIPSNADFMWVKNYTQAGTNGNSGAYFNGVANANVGYEFYWQRGMAPGTGMVKYKSNGAATVNQDTLVSGGFTLYDPSGQSGSAAAPLLSAPVNFTAITNATRPVVSTASTAGLVVGSVVRLSPYLVNGTLGTSVISDLAGIDFVVGAVVANTSFTLTGNAAAALANNPGITSGTGSWRIVNVDSPFYPRKRVITDITQAVNAQVSTALAHGFTPGQEVRFWIPAVSGMVQLDSSSGLNLVAATILTVIDDYNFTINVNTTGYNAFTYPTVAQQPSSFPVVVPVGEDTGVSLTTVASQVPSVGGLQIFNTNTGILADSTTNTMFLGMILGLGGNGLALTTPIIGPAGSIAWSAGNVPTGDVMYWVAGKSSFGGL